MVCRVTVTEPGNSTRPDARQARVPRRIRLVRPLHPPESMPSSEPPSSDPEVRFDIEEPACRLALEGDAPVPALPGPLRAAIERAEREPGPDGSGRCWVRSGAAQARELREYFEQAAAELQLRGDYERSTASAQTAEKISRALQGRPRD